MLVMKNEPNPTPGTRGYRSTIWSGHSNILVRSQGQEFCSLVACSYLGRHRSLGNTQNESTEVQKGFRYHNWAVSSRSAYSTPEIGTRTSFELLIDPSNPTRLVGINVFASLRETKQSWMKKWRMTYAHDLIGYFKAHVGASSNRSEHTWPRKQTVDVKTNPVEQIPSRVLTHKKPERLAHRWSTTVTTIAKFWIQSSRKEVRRWFEVFATAKILFNDQGGNTSETAVSPQRIFQRVELQGPDSTKLHLKFKRNNKESEYFHPLYPLRLLPPVLNREGR